MTVFCNIGTIYTGPSGAAVSVDDLTLSELSGGDPLGTSDAGRPRPQDAEEALGTGVFSGRGRDRVGFAHQTYAELLAARYVANTKIELSERLKLIRHPSDSELRVVPQLRATAAWLASMDNNVFQAVSAADPQVLIRGDISIRDDDERRDLVQALLELADEDKLAPEVWQGRAHFRRLSHPDLPGQLAPYVTDRSKKVAARRFAFYLTQECGVGELESVLVDTSLDEADDGTIRRCAARAVLESGHEEARMRLKPLALSPHVGDPDADLRGTVLHGLWPDNISAEELFNSLEAPSKGSHGAYRYFLSQRLMPGLADADLPHALQWASQRNEVESHDHTVRQLLVEMSRRAWNCLDDQGVFHAMVEYALTRLRMHEDLSSIENEDAVDERAKRRNLAHALVPRLESYLVTCAHGASECFGRLLTGHGSAIERRRRAVVGRGG